MLAMSVIQSKINELRYSKRANLEQEAKIVGNYYRDIIRSFGIDCVYHRLDTSIFDHYKDTVDSNTILQQAYGYNINPDYSCSSDMLAYAEVENDIFQLNKFGLNPETEVNFYFDSNDFACALATKAGQYKEYPIDEIEINCEVPEYKYHYEDAYDEQTSSIVRVAVPDVQVLEDPITGLTTSCDVNQWAFPYHLGLGYQENYTCEVLKGKLSVQLSGYEFNKETTVVCVPYEHSDFFTSFPVNPDIYKSFKHVIKSDDYLQTLLFLTFTVKKVPVTNKRSKCILTGKIHGSILFYDIASLNKYIEKIHPEVGDIVEIDFPDDKNREKYEITDCFDKQLTNDGISPLLHKYIWKCKAKRYVNSYEDTAPTSEADERIEEKHVFDKVIKEQLTEKISLYPDKEDKVYGGYESTLEKSHDKEVAKEFEPKRLDYLDQGELLDIVRFRCGSRLCTTGYDLVFMDADGQCWEVATSESEQKFDSHFLDAGLRYLKACKDVLVFNDIEGKTSVLAFDAEASQADTQICLNSLFDSTTDVTETTETRSSDFYIFKESRTVLWATRENLFCRLSSNNKLYQLV